MDEWDNCYPLIFLYVQLKLNSITGLYVIRVICYHISVLFLMLNGKTEIELDINAESIRLIANTVIFYNASLLSKIYEYYRNTEPEKVKNISRLSPVAWQHLSFIGKYEFCNRGNLIDIQRLTELLITDLKIDI